MKTQVMLMLFLIFIPTTIAAEQWMYESEYIHTSLIISSDISITPKSSKWSTDQVTASLAFIPAEDTRQTITILSFNPPTQIIGDVANFHWDNPTETELTFTLSANLKTQNRIEPILTKIQFPLTGLDAKIKMYTNSQDIINSDDGRINGLATKLTKDEDDLYIAVFKIADYVMKNIQYTLEDKDVAENSKTATWVLENEKGVCDEITSLFTALARSVGIPVKYVSGLAYSNYQDKADWGPHAWAEVYFPGVGWVPYDVTYREIGFIDATHIKLKESLDADESSTEYEWKGREIDVTTNTLSMDVKLLQKRGKMGDFVSIEASLQNTSLPFGAETWIDVEVTNLQDYYVTTEVSLSQSIEVEIDSYLKQHVALAPHGKETLSWKLKPTQNLDPKFVYTIPIIAFTTRNVTSETSLLLRQNTYTSDSADIEILNITHPNTVKFEDTFDISFLLKRNSEIIPTAVHISLHSDTFLQEWNIESMGQDQKFIISLEGKSLQSGINEVSIDISFKGEDGKTFTKEKSFTIDLAQTTLWQRFLLHLYDLDRWVQGLLSS